MATDGRDDSSGITVQFANGNVRQYRLTDDSAKLEWTRREGQKDVAALHYTVAADGSVSLEGRIANDPVQLQLRPVDLQSFPLLRQR